MSFSVETHGYPPLAVATALAIALAPVETPAARVAFWLGLVATLLVFHFGYAPQARAAAEPGSAFCCGVVLTGPPLLYAVYDLAWGGPILRAVAPWIALSAGPVVQLAVVGAGELLARCTLRQVARASPAALEPLLLHRREDIRAAALERLRGLPPTANAGDVARGTVERLAASPHETWHEELAAALVAVVLEQPGGDRAPLLDLYGALCSSRFEPAAAAVEQALCALAWDDPAPLVEAARRRVDQAFAPIDGVVRFLLERHRGEALALARRALRAHCLQAETLLAFGVEDAHSVLEEAVAAREAGERVYAGPVVDALACLPSAFSFPLLTRVLAWDERNLDLDLSRNLRARPDLFRDARRAPEAAEALLEAIARRRAACSTPSERETYAKLAQAIARGLEA